MMKSCDVLSLDLNSIPIDLELIVSIIVLPVLALGFLGTVLQSVCDWTTYATPDLRRKPNPRT